MVNKVNEDAFDLYNQQKYADRVRSLVEAQAAEKGAPLAVFVQTFGCQQNEADSERLLGTALTLGYEPCADKQTADLILINTCAIREHAELKAFSKTGDLKRLKECNPRLIIGMFGCMVTQDHRMDDVKHRYPYVDFVAATNMLHRLPEILCDVLVTKRRRFYVDGGEHRIVEGVPVCRQSSLSAWVSIMYGCDNFCSYCVVPHVRGRERSRDPMTVLDEVQDCVQKGYREITLLGQNVNSYGKSKTGQNTHAARSGEPVTFARLLRRCAGFEGEYWVRFMTSHPKDVSDELIDAMAECQRIAPHFHLPMQAGNNRVLNEMNRRYTREEYFALAQKIKQRIPGISLTTDIICGFPGETEEEFEETLDMVRTIQFDSIYAFLFSPRRGTPAADMPDPVPQEQKANRFARLAALQQGITDRINAGLVGKTVRVLCDGNKSGGFFSGRTGGNKTIRFSVPDGAQSPYGSFVDVRITEAASSKVYGELQL